MKSESQQKPIAEVEEAQPSTPPFLIEVEASVFNKLHTLATKEGVSVNSLGSELIKCLLLLHRSEVKRVIEHIKRNHKCLDLK